MFKKPLYFLIYDIVVVSLAFLFVLWLKPATIRIYLPNYLQPFLIFLGIWLVASIAFRKYRGLEQKNIKGLTWGIISANFIALSLSLVVIYGFQIQNYSRQIVFGTIGIASFIELLAAFVYYNVKHAQVELEPKEKQPKIADYLEKKSSGIEDRQYGPHGKLEENLKKNIIEEIGQDVYDILIEHVNPYHPKTLILSTTTQFNVDKQADEYYEDCINIKDINDIRFVNKFLTAVNYKLPVGGLFVLCGETKNMRKKRIERDYPLILNFFVYLIDFIFSRVFPKFQITKPIYYFFTRGRNRVFTKAEILGRLYYNGFELIREIKTNKRAFFIVHKVSLPDTRPHAKYGLFIKLRRVAKNKKLINVYKMRTMHPYSEYIQDLIFSVHGTSDGDKPINDYRVTNMGKIFRKLWLDELPMIVNLLKREIKIVGVRPLSQSKFSMYPKYMQDKRTRSTPGLIPPFYVDRPDSFEGLVKSEEKYLDLYFKHPIRTDIKYFFKAIYQILIKKARSS